MPEVTKIAKGVYSIWPRHAEFFEIPLAHKRNLQEMGGFEGMDNF